MLLHSILVLTRLLYQALLANTTTSFPLAFSSKKRDGSILVGRGVSDSKIVTPSISQASVTSRNATDKSRVYTTRFSTTKKIRRETRCFVVVTTIIHKKIHKHALLAAITSLDYSLFSS